MVIEYSYFAVISKKHDNNNKNHQNSVENNYFHEINNKIFLYTLSLIINY